RARGVPPFFPAGRSSDLWVLLRVGRGADDGGPGSRVEVQALRGGGVGLRSAAGQPVAQSEGAGACEGEGAGERREDARLGAGARSEEHTSELQSRENLVC